MAYFNIDNQYVIYTYAIAHRNYKHFYSEKLWNYCWRF